MTNGGESRAAAKSQACMYAIAYSGNDSARTKEAPSTRVWQPFRSVLPSDAMYKDITGFYSTFVHCQICFTASRWSRYSLYTREASQCYTPLTYSAVKHHTPTSTKQTDTIETNLLDYTRSHYIAWAVRCAMLFNKPSRQTETPQFLHRAPRFALL